MSRPGKLHASTAASSFTESVIREAISATYGRDYGLSVDPETEVCVTCGATEAMSASFLGLLDPDDEVIVFEPFYENKVHFLADQPGVAAPRRERRHFINK